MKYSKKGLLFFLFIIGIGAPFFANQSMPTTNAEILKAAHEGNSEAFEKLIKNKKNVNIKDEHGNTPLHIAAKKGHGRVVRLLVEYDVPQGYGALLWQWLFGSKSPYINDQNNDGDTAVHCAAECDDIEGLVSLMMKDPNLLVKNKKNYTPLLLAADKGKKNNVLYLMHICHDYYKQTANGNTIVHQSLANGHYDLAKEIITINSTLHKHNPKLSGDNALVMKRNSAGETSLLCCARLNNNEMVDILLHNGAVAVINIPDIKEYMPLSYACYNKNNPMIASLIKNNATANKSVPAHAMPIHIAFDSNNYSLASYLISLGVDINGQESHGGNSPLLVATENNEYCKIDWLMKNGADIKKCNKQGLDVGDIVIRKKNKDLLSYYKTYGISIDRVDADGRTRFMNALVTGNNDMLLPLVALDADVSHIDKEHNNGLHLAAKGNNIYGAKIVLERNKKLVFSSNKFGNTPLHYAADSPQSFELVALYIKSNAHINAQNNEGESPLHRAAASGNIGVIQLLKQHNALSLLTVKRNSPAHYVLMHDTYECLSSVLDAQTINVFNTDGKSVMTLAIEKKLPEQMLRNITKQGLDLTLASPTESGNSYLHHAIFCHHNDAVAFCAIPSLINKKNNNNSSALSYAVQQKNKQAVTLLLHKKAMQGVPDKYGWTEAHHAAASDDDSIFDMIFSTGALYRQRTNSGDLPLHIAAQNNRISTIKKIVHKSDDRSAKNNARETPVMVAAYNGRIEAMEVLLQPTDFIDGTVDIILQKIPASFLRMSLEKRVQDISNECYNIITKQHTLQALLRSNKTNHATLKQKAIEEDYHYSNNYNPTPSFEEYTFEQLKKKLPAEREQCRRALEAIMQKEEKDHDILLKKIKDNEEQQKEKLKKQREKDEQEQVGRIAQEVQKVEEQECDLCNEMKKDTQQRCVCEQCDKKICLTCITTWQGQGKSTCPYCFNALKKNT